jgi:DNA-binding NtrC family response regulator
MATARQVSPTIWLDDRLRQMTATSSAQNVRFVFPRNPENERFVRELIEADFVLDGALSLDQDYEGREVYMENDVRSQIADGTLFLDEIGEVPLSSQAKLLKFLEDGVIQRIGGRSGKKVNTRVVSATNRDLWQQVTEGRFRKDLYYRLAVITLEVTPLRQQPKLVRHLVDHFVGAANRMRKPKMRVSEDCLAALDRYSFPGNIRELHNLIQHLSVAADEEARPEHLPSYVLRGERDDTIDTGNQNETGPTQGGSFKIVTMSPRSLKEQVKEFERALIDNAIDRLGSKRKAARALGVDIGTIVRKTQGGPAPPRRH